MENRCKYLSICLLKVILSFVILLRHCGQWFFSVNSIFYQMIVNTISPVCVPTFFCISGFLFFNRERNNGQLIKYVYKLIILYLIATILYSPLFFPTAVSFVDVLRIIRAFLFDGLYYHLWYMPALICAISIVFQLKEIGNLKLCMIGVVLYIIGTLVNTYGMNTPQIFWSVYFKLFITTRNGLFFCLPVITGKILADYKNIILTISKKCDFALLLGTAILLFVESNYLSSKNVTVVNMNFTSILMAPLITIFSLKLESYMPYKKTIIESMSSFSTAMYCVHPWGIIFGNMFENKFIASIVISIILSFIWMLILDKIVYIKSALAIN